MNLRSLSPLPAALLAVSLAAQGANKGFWVDAEIGVKLRPPQKWAWLGGDGDLGCLRALLAAPRDYDSKVGLPHTPTVRVLWFRKPAEAAEATATKEGYPRRTPYADAADYLARVHGPSAKVEGKEVAKCGGLEGHRYRVKVPRKEGDLALELFVAKAGEGEVAVELEVLADQLERVRKEAAEAFDSLGAVPMVAAKPVAPPPWAADREAWTKLAAAERGKQRLEWSKRWLEQRKAQAELGFKVQATKAFVVQSRADAKWTPRVAQVAELMRAWADKRFAALSDEVALPATIRVLADAREAAAYRLRAQEPREFDPVRREILCWQDKDVGNTGAGFGELARGVVQAYLHDKAPGIVPHLPRWLDYGLGEYLRSTRIKDKVEFVADEIEVGRFEYHFQHDSLLPLWELIQESNPNIVAPKDGAVEPAFGYIPECARLVRWLEAGNGKLLGHADFLVDYLKAVQQVQATTPPDPGKDVDWLRLSEDQAKEVRKLRYAWRDDLARRVNDIGCSLAEDKWRAATAQWVEWNKKWKP